MNYLEEFYRNYDEEGRLLSQNGQVEYITTEKWVEYHLATCERQDLVGASHHTLDILRKR